MCRNDMVENTLESLNVKLHLTQKIISIKPVETSEVRTTLQFQIIWIFFG